MTELTIQVRCEGCGNDLEASTHKDIVYVTPCVYCMDTARQEAKEG